MGSKDVQLIITGKDQTGGLFSKIRQESMLTQRTVDAMGGSFGKLNGIISGSAAVAGGLAGYQGLSSGLQASIGSAFEFAKNIEVSATGMSGILMSMGQIDGKTIEWNDALAISQKIISKMNDEALRTAATSEELIHATQALLAPGLGAGMTIDQITTLTVTGVNAVKSIGLQSFQVVQELRDLVAGGIQPASSTLATALGLKDSDIAAAKASSQGLFSFLMERLKGFEVSSGEYAKTWRGITEQLQEGVTRAGAAGMDPLFSAIKSEMAGLVSQIVQVDEKTKTVKINPELVAGISSAASTAVIFANEMKSLGQTIWSVAQPVGSVLVPAMRAAVENAQGLTMAIAGWTLLPRAGAMFTNFAAASKESALIAKAAHLETVAAELAAAKGASAAILSAEREKQIAKKNSALISEAAIKAENSGYYLLAGQIRGLSADYVKLGVSAKEAGFMQMQAAEMARKGNFLQASQLIAVRDQHLSAAMAAEQAASKTVTSASIAGGAIKTLASTTYTLMGGWIGVAFWISTALNSLTEWEERTSGDRAKNNRRNLSLAAGGIWSDDMGALLTDEPARMGQLNKPRAQQFEIDAAREAMWREKSDALTAKFAAKGIGSGAAERAYEEEQRLRDKIADMVAKMNAKIRADTETTYEANTAKLKDEIANTKRDLDKSAIDFAKYGIDVSGVYSKITEYQQNQTAKFAKEQSQRLQSLKLETMANNAAITGDYEAAAEARYQAELKRIQETAVKRRIEVGNTTEVDKWVLSETRKAEQERLQIKIDGFSKEHAMRLQMMDFQRQQGLLSADNYRAGYLAEVDAFIASNQRKLQSVRQFSDEWKNLTQATSDAIAQKHRLLGQNVTTSWAEAMYRMDQNSYDYANRITSMFDEMGNTLSTGLYETMTNTGDGLKNVFGNICNSILKMWYDMIVQMYVMAPMRNMFSGMFGGTSTGGGTVGPTMSQNTFAAMQYSQIMGTHNAEGGYQRGPGTGTSDSILSWLSNGEYVVKAAAVKKYGIGMFDALNQMRVPRFAAGGPVSGGSGRGAVMQPNIDIRVINQTGTQVSARQQSSFDSETNTAVISIVMDALENDRGGLRTAIGGLRG